MTLQRHTIASKKVLELLSQQSRPISIPQLSTQLLESGISPNKTTLYRMFDKLKANKMITETVHHNGVSYFELSDKPHHHHFFCTACDAVFCLGKCTISHEKLDLTSLLPSPKFSLSHHEFNLYGTCEICTTSHPQGEIA